MRLRFTVTAVFAAVLSLGLAACGSSSSDTAADNSPSTPTPSVSAPAPPTPSAPVTPATSPSATASAPATPAIPTPSAPVTSSAPRSTGSPAASGGKLNLISAGTLSVCTDVPFAPFEDFDKSSASGFKGFDIDLVSTIAKDLRLKLKVVDTDFDDLQSGLALNEGTCDLVASALTMTPDREKRLTFSDGYYDSAQSLLVLNSSKIMSIMDLDGKKVGVQAGTTGEDYAKKYAHGATVVSFPSDAQEFLALDAGQVDALLQDLPVNLKHEQDGGYQVVEQYDTGERYGFAAKKGNTALIKAVDKDLAAMRADGRYKTIYHRYFSTK